MASTILEQILENVQAGARVPLTDKGLTGISQNRLLAVERSIFQEVERCFERMLDDATRHSRRAAHMFSNPDVRRHLESAWNELLDSEVRPAVEFQESTTFGASVDTSLSISQIFDQPEQTTPSLDAGSDEPDEESDEVSTAIDTVATTDADTSALFESPTPSVLDAVEAELAIREVKSNVALPPAPAETRATAETSAPAEIREFSPVENPDSEMVKEVRDLLRSMQPNASVTSGDEILQRLQTLTREVRDLAKREVVVSNQSGAQGAQTEQAPAPAPQKRVEIGDIEGMIDGLLGM